MYQRLRHPKSQTLRPNFYQLLELDPEVQDWKNIEQRIREMRDRWSFQSTMASPRLREDAERNLGLLHEISTVMKDPEFRRYEAAACPAGTRDRTEAARSGSRAPRIFISYRREDSIDATGRLHDNLAAHFGQESVFMDVDAIPFGADFRKHVQDAVGRADVLLAVIGERWLEARDPGTGVRRLESPQDFVALEIRTALERGIPVIPVLVGRASMPRAEELPEGLRDLAHRNAAELRPGRDFQSHVQRLIKALGDLQRKV
jgi:hypothetical protein